MEFGEILKQLRTSHNLTQKQLGKMLGFSNTTIRDWEVRGTEPNFNTIRKLTEIFDVTAGQLLGIEELII